MKAPATAALAPYLRAAALGVGGGALAAAFQVPLGWLIGAMLACAAGAAFAPPLAVPPFAREAAQALVGLGIGLKLTASVLGQAAALVPAILGATLYVVALSFASAALLRRMAKLDGPTAFLATAAAGVTEMAVLARRRGADDRAVALVQAQRVSIIVLIVPALVVLFGGGRSGAAADPALGGGALLVLVAAAVLAAMGMARLRGVPNPWLFGPLLAGGAYAGATGAGGSMPGWVLVGAQVVLGTVLGCRFDREALARAPRVAAAGAIVALALIAASLLAALALRPLTGLPVATGVLAVAPAGLAEMVLTAKSLDLDAVAVTAFHLARIVLVNAGAPALLALYERLDPDPAFRDAP